MVSNASKTPSQAKAVAKPADSKAQKTAKPEWGKSSVPKLGTKEVAKKEEAKRTSGLMTPRTPRNPPASSGRASLLSKGSSKELKEE